MNRSRCPWCGKRIHLAEDQKHVKQEKTPRRLVFAQCGHCRNYYGESFHSKRVKICFWGSILSILLAFLTQIGYLAFLALPLVLVACFGSFEKMNEQEDLVVEMPSVHYDIAVLEGGDEIQPRTMYFLNNRFDDCTAFSTVSPIYFISSDLKNHKTSVRFLYEHAENEAYMAQESLAVYDTEMKFVAKIRFDH